MRALRLEQKDRFQTADAMRAALERSLHRAKRAGVALPPGSSVISTEPFSKEQAEAKIASALGGRIAEEIMFGRLTTGAGNDIESATDLARRMVCEWGMSEKLGPLAYGKKEEQVFLGRDYGSRTQDYSEQTAVEIDQEVRSLIQHQYTRVRELLTEKKDKLEALAKALVERETLDAEEILAVYEGRDLPKRERVIIQSYADKEKAAKEKRKVASIFGGPPKPATNS